MYVYIYIIMIIYNDMYVFIKYMCKLYDTLYFDM